MSWSSKKVLGVALLLLLGLGLASAVAAYVLVDRAFRTSVERVPLAWTDSLREAARVPPEVSALGLPRTDEGDGAAVVYAPDTSGAWAAPAGLVGAYGSLFMGRAASARDSATWRAVAADTSLDQFVRAARKRRWDALAQTIARSDSSAAHNVFALAIPRLASRSAAARGLAIRGRMRLARGDRTGALEDLRATVGLGEMMARREPTLFGNLSGLAVVRIGAQAMRHYAEVVGDTTRARQADAGWAWARKHRKITLSQLLVIYPDSALVVARDTTLALGWRGAALAAPISARLERANGWLFGIPGRVTERLTPFRQDRDPDLACLADIVSRTAEWLNGLGPRRRFRLITGVGG